MAKIMDPILGYWAIILGSFAGSGMSKLSRLFSGSRLSDSDAP